MADSNVEKILKTLLDHADRVVDFDCAYLSLYNPVRVELDFPPTARKVSTRIDQSGPEENWWASRPYQPSRRLPDCIFATGEPVLIQEDFKGWIDKEKLSYRTGELPRSWLGVPLRARGRVAAVFALEDYRRERAFGERTLDILSAMANRTAGALANARLVGNLRAVNTVGQRLASGIRLSLDEILSLIYDLTSELMDTRDMYIALYDPGRQELSFPLAMLNGDPQKWDSRKVDIRDQTKGGLTEEVIRTGKPLRVPDFEGWFRERGLEPPVKPPPKSWLGVPIMVEDRVLGVIALVNDEVENLYGEDDKEFLEMMAGQTAVAIANARLVHSLSALTEVGQRLTSGIDLTEEDILDLIYRQASQLMDTRDMYIALYDRGRQELSFPLAKVNGEDAQFPPRQVDIRDQTKGGLTEEVIRTGKPLRVPDFEGWYREKGFTPPVKPYPKSWLGVPMMVEDRVLGVIAVQNDEVEDLYRSEDEATLQTMAGQAAIAAMAIENARLLQDLRKEQERKIAEAKFLYLGHAADGIAHRINNTIALLPLCVGDIRRHQKTVDSFIDGQLEMIERNVKYILELSEILQKPSAQSEPGRFDINRMAQDAIRAANVPEDVEVTTIFDVSLPKIQTRRLMVDVFVELITNAIKAMSASEVKRLEIGTRIPDDRSVDVWFKDTGVGIPNEQQERIFDLFYTTAKKEPTQGVSKGFGLWWIRTFLASQEGEITVESRPGEGATFWVRVPREVRE